MALVHHELCFGCGRTNLFGLMLEAEHAAPDTVTGRCFIKQDHQGADLGSAHDGVLAAALSEAMALVCGLDARPTQIEVRYLSVAPVGTFVAVQAQVHSDSQDTISASAIATVDERKIATAAGTYRLG